MLALQGKGALAPYCDELKVFIHAVMHIHDINAKKHPFMSWQKTPEKSDALPLNSLHALYRHTLAFLANKVQDEHATHMESIACRLWMFVTAIYRHHNLIYDADTHSYVKYAKKDAVCEVIDRYNTLYSNACIDKLYIHFAAEPLISLYKTLNNPDINIEEVPETISKEFAEERYVYHLQLYQCILHTIMFDERYSDPVTNNDLLTEITIVDLLLYHFMYSYYYYYHFNKKCKNS